MRAQIAHGGYEPSELFGNGSAGRKIADVLAAGDPPLQKRLHYDPSTLVAGALA